MGVEETIKLIEGRTRDYVLHFTGVFGPNVKADRTTGPLDGPTLVFALFSLAIGVSLQDTVIRQEKVHDIDFLTRFVAQICFWILISVVVHLALRCLRRSVTYETSLVITLTALPVAFVIGAYAAFVAHGVAEFFDDERDPTWARGLSSLADALVQLAIIGRCLPGALYRLTDTTRIGRAAVTVAVMAVLGSIDVLTVYGLKARDLAYIWKTISQP